MRNRTLTIFAVVALALAATTIGFHSAMARGGYIEKPGIPEGFVDCGSFGFAPEWMVNIGFIKCGN